MPEGIRTHNRGDVIEILIKELNKLRADVAELRSKYNAHTHTENAEAVYTQNVSTSAPPAGSQAAAMTATEDVTCRGDNV